MSETARDSFIDLTSITHILSIYSIQQALPSFITNHPTYIVGTISKMASITNLLCFKPSPEPEVTYLPIPADDEHFHRINHLSIEAPLLLASVPPRTTDLPRSLRELPRAFKPTRFRLLPTSPNAAREERPAFYFEILHVDVYANARRFVNMHFGYGDVPYLEEEDEDEGHSLWLEGGGFPKEFLRYASLVARQDNLLGGWEALLRNEKERTTMLCGIIARALEDGAWDRLLFGANEEQERLLDEMDAGTIRCEGMFPPQRCDRGKN